MSVSPRALFSRLHPSNCALLVCDLQEKFRDKIQYFPQILITARRLIDAAKVMDIPIVATEQYPKGLGHSAPELSLKENNIPIFEKTSFSMCVPDVNQLLGPQVKSIIVCGIEAHVCVYHTTLDFLDKGYSVHVVVDATSSRSMTDRLFAFRQLEKAGAVLTTSECVILGLVRDSSHPRFKDIQKIIIESAPDTGLVPSSL